MLFDLTTILIISALFGITMKIADLFNEHKMKSWFPGSSILFGILYGGLGVVLILSDTTLANVILAMIVAFILRYRIDYLNHGIAASIILISFLYKSVFDINVFLPLFLAFALFGLIEDYVSEKLNKEIKIPKRLPFYSPIVFVYAIITGNWVIFLSLFLYELFYIITDIYGVKVVKKQESH